MAGTPDGDQRWTSQFVREWWKDIDRVVRWIEERLRDESYLSHYADQLRQGLFDFETYIASDLHTTCGVTYSGCNADMSRRHPMRYQNSAAIDVPIVSTL